MRRAVALVFAHPFLTPTQAELGMQFAKTAAFRSADLSRQVGYAALSDDGQLIAVGTNDVAKPGGGLYWPEDPNDARDFRFAEKEPNADLKTEILSGLLKELQKIAPPVVSPQLKLDSQAIEEIAEKIKHTLFWSITEYGRAVHAELSLITDAARRGVSLQGATMFGTTFPCHNCAKSIVSAGVRRVVYVEPYPKSQVVRLYRDSISIETACDDKVIFEPFVGIAPQRFADFFMMADRKDEESRVVSWEEKKRDAVPRISADPQYYLQRESEQMDVLGTAVADDRIRFATSETQQESESEDDPS